MGRVVYIPVYNIEPNHFNDVSLSLATRRSLGQMKGRTFYMFGGIYHPNVTQKALLQTSERCPLQKYELLRTNEHIPSHPTRI